MLTVWRKNSMKPRTNLRLNSKGALCTSIRGWLVFKQQLSLQAAACWAEAHFLFPPGHMDLTFKIRISFYVYCNNCWTKPKYFPITVEQDRVERSFEAIEQSILSNTMARWSCEACCRSVAEWCSWFWLQEPFSSWFNWLCLSQSAGSFLGNEHKKR